MQVGLLFLGVLGATLIAFGYSLAILARRPAAPVPERPSASFDFVVVDSVAIGVAVGASLLLGEASLLSRPYWVPATCLPVLQASSLRAAWHRAVHIGRAASREQECWVGN